MVLGYILLGISVGVGIISMYNWNKKRKELLKNNPSCKCNECKCGK
jgi:hypothetical protein